MLDQAQVLFHIQIRIIFDNNKALHYFLIPNNLISKPMQKIYARFQTRKLLARQYHRYFLLITLITSLGSIPENLFARVAGATPSVSVLLSRNNQSVTVSGKISDEAGEPV